jgi:hypothetical protein
VQYDMKYTVKSLKADDWNSTKTAPTPTLKLRVRDPFELKESINREKERLAFPRLWLAAEFACTKLHSVRLNVLFLGSDGTALMVLTR